MKNEFNIYNVLMTFIVKWLNNNYNRLSVTRSSETKTVAPQDTNIKGLGYKFSRETIAIIGPLKYYSFEWHSISYVYYFQKVWSQRVWYIWKAINTYNLHRYIHVWHWTQNATTFYCEPLLQARVNYSMEFSNGSKAREK